MGINDGNNPIVADSVISGLDADINTGREDAVEKETEKKQPKEGVENKNRSTEGAKETAQESADAQKISQQESRR
jgi:hypothetical protein